MTYKAFMRMVSAIRNESYTATKTDPLDYAIGRAKFEEFKLNRLLALAEQVVPTRMAIHKAADWRHQWQRVHRIRTKLEEREIASRILTNARNQNQPAIWFSMSSPPLECWRPSGPG